MTSSNQFGPSSQAVPSPVPQPSNQQTGGAATTAVAGKAPSSLLIDYRPLPGTWDEFVAADGKLRDHCRPLMQHLDAVGSIELSRRWDQAQRTIRDAGVTFNAHDESGTDSRPWELDAVPMVMPTAEWSGLSEALKQRAQLLELLLGDLFGARTLLRDRIIPPELVFANPCFHRALSSVPQPAGWRLQLYAADMARADDGSWWVTGDRTRAPSGLGYVLENRIVTSQMLPMAFRYCNVERLASFFSSLRQTLKSRAPRFRDNPRIVLLSKGPSSDTYFEDAYLARYLGYTLAEGGDLAVRGNHLMLKTLGSLLPVEVLLRRINDDDCDPVELDGGSPCGVSGLLEVIRSGNVAVTNSIGSWVAESPAFVPFLPAICRHLMSEDLQLPSVATWWCGDKAARDRVLANLDSLIVRPAFRTSDQPPTSPARLTPKARQELIAAITARPEDFVAQEQPERSTTPVWVNGRLVPWYVALRMFVTATNDAPRCLSGGLIRVSPDRDSLDQSMTSGERSQDFWVLSGGPVAEVSLLQSSDVKLELRRSGAELPSRVADNLFWLGRNLERADALSRLLRTTFIRLSNVDLAPSESGMTCLMRALAENGQIEPGFVVGGMRQLLPDLERVLPESVFNADDPNSLRSVVLNILRLGRTVRDRISTDAWRLIHRLGDDSRKPGRYPEGLDSIDVLAVLSRLMTGLTSFSGLCGESMTRTLGWRFLELGRRIERACQTAILLESTLVQAAGRDLPVLEAVLETCDSVMTYRSRYLATIQIAPVLDLLVTDETNPRSIAYQLVAINDHVSQLPLDQNRATRNQEELIAMDMLNLVRMVDPFEIGRTNDKGTRVELERLMQRLTAQLPRLSDAISNRYLIHAGLPRQFSEEQSG